MWKEEDIENSNVNSISHLNVDNISFVLNLRDNQKKKKISYTKHNKQHSPIQKHQKNRINISNEDTKLLKDNGCMNEACILSRYHIYDALRAKSENCDYLDELNNLIEDSGQVLNFLNEKYQSSLNQQEELNKRLDNILNNEQSLKQQSLMPLKELSKELEEKIKEAQSDLLKLKTSTQNKPAKIKSNIFFDKTKSKNNLKHNGLFEISWSGKKAWSCCSSQNIDSPGCIDDQSIGGKSEILGKDKKGFRNYTELPSSIPLSSSSIMSKKAQKLRSQVINCQSSGILHYNRPRSAINEKYFNKTSSSILHNSNSTQGFINESRYSEFNYLGNSVSHNLVNARPNSSFPYTSGQSRYLPYYHKDSDKSKILCFKSSIGKVKCDPDRSQLVKNRPMTAKLGYSLYVD